MSNYTTITTTINNESLGFLPRDEGFFEVDVEMEVRASISSSRYPVEFWGAVSYETETSIDEVELISAHFAEDALDGNDSVIFSEGSEIPENLVGLLDDALDRIELDDFDFDY